MRYGTHRLWAVFNTKALAKGVEARSELVEVIFVWRLNHEFYLEQPVNNTTDAAPRLLRAYLGFSDDGGQNGEAHPG